MLRATIDSELLHGPDYYVTCGPAAGGWVPTPYSTWGGSNARIILSRWPILSVLSVKTCPNNVWPRIWTSVTPGFFEPEQPPVGLYGSSAPGPSAQGGQAILIAPGWIDWTYGRNGWAIQVQYVNGWPHAELTASVAAGSNVITVNDTTGWALTNFAGVTGATGVIKDSGQQESIHVASSSTTSGPGTLTLSANLTYPHQAGTIVTTLPATIEQACILFATAEALTRGATSTTIHSVGGHGQVTGGDVEALASEAELLCHPYKRVI